MVTTKPFCSECGGTLTLSDVICGWCRFPAWKGTLTELEARAASQRDQRDSDPSRLEGVAWVLEVLSARLAMVGRTDEAIERAREAVEVRQGVVEDHGAGQSYRSALGRLRRLLTDVGRAEEVAEMVRAAVAPSESLVEKARSSPDPDRSNLARALTALGKALGEVGDPVQAVTVQREGVELWARVARTANFWLATSLFELAEEEANLGNREEALRIVELAVRVDAAVPEPTGPTFTTDRLSIARDRLLAALGRVSGDGAEDS